MLKKIDVERYYKMSNEDLESEAQKFKMGSYFDGRIIRREKIIEQLIAKDTSIMLRYTLTATFVAVCMAVISLIISLIAVFI